MVDCELSLVPSETHLFFSRSKSCEWHLSHVCSENGIFIGNVHWSPAKRWSLFHLPNGVSNFCNTSAAKALSCLQLFTGLQRNDYFFVWKRGVTCFCYTYATNIMQIHISINGSGRHCMRQWNTAIALVESEQIHINCKDSWNIWKPEIPKGFLWDS